MKTHPLILTICAFAIGVSPAAAGEYAVTPTTLNEWQLTGPTPAGASAASQLILPGGASLSRRFAGASAVVCSVSTPSFGGTSADWPVLQVGPAALALIRSGDRGQLALLVGNSASTLPTEIALDAAGRSAAPLELALGYSSINRRGIVVIAGEVREFVSDISGPLEVTVSAGKGGPWTHDSLIVAVSDATSAPPDANAGHSAEASRVFAASQASVELLRRMEAPPSEGEAHAKSGVDASTARGKPAVRPVILEIFTPPAVRHGPTAVRVEIARQRNSDPTPP